MVRDDIEYLLYSIGDLGLFEGCRVSFEGNFYPIRKDRDYLPDGDGKIVFETAEDIHAEPITVFEFQKVLQFYQQEITEMSFLTPRGEEEHLVCAFQSDKFLGEPSLVIAVGDGSVSMADIGR